MESQWLQAMNHFNKPYWVFKNIVYLRCWTEERLRHASSCWEEKHYCVMEDFNYSKLQSRSIPLTYNIHEVQNDYIVLCMPRIG